MKSLIQDKMVTITVMAKNENTFAVELKDTSVIPAINVREHLLESGCAVEGDATISRMLEGSTGILQEVNGKRETAAEAYLRSWLHKYLGSTLKVGK